MRYTQIPVDTFKTLQMNAGILVSTFTPASGVIGDIICATTGGIQFDDTPEYEDFGADIDNCPKNTKELKRKTSNEVKLSGTAASIKADTIKLFAGTADSTQSTATTGDKKLLKITPRFDLLQSDFKSLWWVGDYSDENGDNGGFIAIELINALSTDGFKLRTGDKAKGTFPFAFTGHYSIQAQKVVPYNIYLLNGAAT